jgi:hypothetical protein
MKIPDPTQIYALINYGNQPDVLIKERQHHRIMPLRVNFGILPDGKTLLQI